MKKDKTYLKDILDAIEDIENFTDTATEEAFCKNKEKQYAVLRALEIIGEATKSLSKGLKVKYHDVPWKEISGMRDKLIHMYFGVKLDLVWETIKVDLPELKGKIYSILKNLDGKY